MIYPYPFSDKKRLICSGNHLLRKKLKLNLKEINVLSELVHNPNVTKEKTVPFLSEYMRLSERTIYSAINELLAKKIIVKKTIEDKNYYLETKIRNIALEELKEQGYKTEDIEDAPSIDFEDHEVLVDIYVMIDEHTGFHKIGLSNCAEKREKTLLSLAPKIKLLFYFKGKRQDERILHKKFKNKRFRGEWFDLSEKDLEFIKQYGGVK